MKLLVALYDRAVEAYAPVMTVNTRNEALRSFRQACNDPNTPINANPTDYELHVLANYNDQTGQIEGFLQAETLARAEDHKS